MPQDRKRYLLGGVGVLALGAVITVTIVLIVKRSGKDDSVTTDKQTKEELKEPVDPCVTLLAEYVKAGESGMTEEQLKALYAKGSAQCPTVFLPQQQEGELPKLEEVQARLVKKQEEQKREGGVNKGERTEERETSGVTVPTLASKGNGSAADPSKPATVPLAKSSTTEIKNNNDQPSDKTKVEPVDDKTPQQPQVPVPNASQPSGNSNTSGSQPTASNTLNPNVTTNTTVTQLGGNLTTTTVPTPSGNAGTSSIVDPNTTGPITSGTSSNAGTQSNGTPTTTVTQPSGTQTTTVTQPNVPPVTTVTQPNVPPVTTVTQPSGLNGQPNASNPTPQGTNSTPPSTPLTPKEMKEERTKAKSECMEMINTMVKQNQPGKFVDAFTEEQRELIKKYAKEGLIPSHFNEDKIVEKFWSNKMTKLMKTGKAKEAQEALVNAVKSLGLDPAGCDITEMNEYKFWTAMATDDRLAMEQSIKSVHFLPTFIREDPLMYSDKLKFLKELNDAQMDALFEYSEWNKDLEKCVSDYDLAKDEWKMADLEARYNNVAEKMNLLKEDIHKDFNFALPALPEKKSVMQELDEKLINKTPEFEAAFKKLRGDRSKKISSVVNALKELKEPQDQIALLETLNKVEGKNYHYLPYLLIDAVEKSETEDRIRNSLHEADFKNPQHLANINEALKWVRSCEKDAFKLARLDLWMQFVAFVQSLTDSFDEVHASKKTTLVQDLHDMASLISPHRMQELGEYLSLSKIGAEGTKLIEQCALCMQKRFESDPTNDRFKADHKFAQAYVNLYKSVNGANLEDMRTQVSALRI